MEKNLLMHHEPFYKKALNAKNYLLALAMLAGVQTNVLAQIPSEGLEEPECKMYATSSEFYPNIKVENVDDIKKSFADYDIVFDVKNGLDYQLGSDLKGFFGKAPVFENGRAVLEEANCMFLKNPNGIVYTLGYPTEFMKNKMYRYKIRAYIQAPKDCTRSVADALGNATVGFKTQFPSSEYDVLEIKACDSNGNLLISKRIANDGVGNHLSEEDFSVELSELYNLDSIKLGDIIRLDIEISGRLPEESDNLEYFKLSPKLSQFDCAKVAVEYWVAEYEAYCISSQSACKGDFVTAHAAGFYPNSTYEWYKKNGEIWEKLEDVKVDDSNAKILVENVGATRYKVVVSDPAFLRDRELEFNVYGMSCGCDDDSIIKSKLFAHGTDFNPTGLNTGYLNQDVENKFVENDIVFTKGDCAYTISSDESENYFMNITNPNGRIAEFKVPFNENLGQGYHFAMSAYLQPTCMLDKDARFLFRSTGSMQFPNMVVSAYDETTGEFIGVAADDNNFIKLSSLLKGNDFPKTDTSYHRLRFDVEYYGMISEVANGLTYDILSPEVVNFPCSNLSIDYMDLDISEVLMSYSIRCKGEISIANAAGFPRKSVYSWYVKEESGWRQLASSSESQNVEIDVDYIGGKDYKLVVDTLGSAPVVIGFTVFGKDCSADSINTDVEILDADVDAVVNVYTVDGVVLKKNVRLSEALIDLKRGFYIIGNKKVYVDK